MYCSKLFKEENTVFMMDDKGTKLNLEDDRVVYKYEKVNDVEVKDMIAQYLGKDFEKIIKEIEELVDKYNIDYFMCGEGKEVCQGSLALVYNINNRNSYIDCDLKVFVNLDNNCREADRIRYMIKFYAGSTGNNYGFDFYKYFTYDDFYIIKNELEKYFASKESESSDIGIINTCSSNISRRISSYYR